MGIGALYITLGSGWNVFRNINNKVGPIGLFFVTFSVVFVYFSHSPKLICVVVSCLLFFFASFVFWCPSFPPLLMFFFLHFPRWLVTFPLYLPKRLDDAVLVGMLSGVSFSAHSCLLVSGLRMSNFCTCLPFSFLAV